MTQTQQPPETALDLRGYRCPAPVIRLEAALRKASPGARFRVIVDDPLAVVDIPHFCREGGHSAERERAAAAREGYCVFQVTRGPNPA